jgi:hypothetical protein
MYSDCRSRTMRLRNRNNARESKTTASKPTSGHRPAINFTSAIQGFSKHSLTIQPRQHKSILPLPQPRFPTTRPVPSHPTPRLPQKRTPISAAACLPRHCSPPRNDESPFHQLYAFFAPLIFIFLEWKRNCAAPLHIPL